MAKRGHRHIIDSIAGLLVYGIFAVCILAVLLSGAKVYGRIVARDNTAYESRTSIQYIATKLRQAETPYSVDIISENGIPVLRFQDMESEVLCYSYIYCYDGYMRELYALADAGFEPDAGEKLMKASSVDIRVEGDMLTVTITGEDGRNRQLRHCLSAGGTHEE